MAVRSTGTGQTGQAEFKTLNHAKGWFDRVLVLLLPALLLARPAFGTAESTNAPAPASGTNVTLGVLLPPEEAQGLSLREGVELAAAQANKTPGKHVGIVVRGRVGQWGADAPEAARMVLDDGALALIAPPDGSATHLALQVAGRTATPVVSLCADSSIGHTGVPWLAQVGPRTIDEAALAFSRFTISNSVQHWIALVPPERAGREISNDLSRASIDAKCIIDRVFAVSATNRTAIMNQVIRSNASGVLIWLDPIPAGACVRLLKLAGYSGAVIGPTRLHCPEFVAAAGDALDGFVLPGLVLDGDGQARFQAFQAVFRHQYKREPDIMAAFSFDAAALAIQILRGNDPEALPRAFPPGAPVAGVTGTMIFDTDGTRKLPLQLLVFDRGSFVPF